MVSIYSVDANELIKKVAESLKTINEIKPPVWAGFVKTGMHKERPPLQEDWWYLRSAAVLRNVFKLGPIGTNKLKIRYGGKKNRGHKKEEFRKASGNIIRKVLQQLEKAGLVKKVEKEIHRGRIITGKGKSILDKAAVEILKVTKKEKIVPEVKKETPKKEVKKEEKKKKPAPKEKKAEPKKEAPKKEEPQQKNG